MKLSGLSTVEVLNGSLIYPVSLPLWGGMFERMIRSMKKYLILLLGQSRVDYEQLHKSLAEIQTVISNRPLTSLYHEPVECSSQVTCYLVGKSI